MKKFKQFIVIAMLSMMTMGFTPFISSMNGVVNADGNVAEINGTRYSTVQEAVNAAMDNVNVTVKMIASSTENVTIASNKKITLDMNGFVLNGTGNGSVITNNGTLTVKNGTVTGGSGTSNIVSGKVVGGGIYNAGELSLVSVKITGNAVDKDNTTAPIGRGGGIYNKEGAKLDAKDTEITNNTASEQGGGIFNKGTVNIVGGCVSDNNSKMYSAGVAAGGTSMTVENCTITRNTITGEKAKYAAGIDWWKGTLTLKGKVVIFDNKTNGKQDNLFLEFEDDNTTFTANTLTSGSKIGIGHLTKPVVKLTSGDTVDLSSYYVSDNEKYVVVYDKTNKNLLLKNVVYVKDTGDDTTGTGTEEKPYRTIQKAVETANEVKALSDIKLESNCDLKCDIDLCGHAVELNDYTFIFDGGKFKSADNKPVTFLISSSKDFAHAAEISQQSESEISYVWKLTKDINREWIVELNDENGNYKKITIDGNNHKLIAPEKKTQPASLSAVTEEQSHVLYFRNNTPGNKEVEIKDLTIEVNDGFRSGICFDKDSSSGHPAIKANLNNVKIKLNHTEAPKKSCVPLQINNADVTLSGNTEITSDKYSWSAIDVDGKNGEAKLTIDGNNVSINDNRSSDVKATSPVVKLANTSSVVNPEKANLAKVTDGYNFKATVTFESNGGSSVNKIESATQMKVTKPTDPTKNGYKFAGWYKEASLTNAWDFDKDTLQGDTTLYAKWTSVDGTAVTDADDDGLDTGDHNKLMLYSILFVAMVAGIAIMMHIRKREQK